MTNLPAYAMAARAAGLTVKRFDLILADSGSFILVVMLSDSSVKNKLIRLPVELTEADLKLLGTAPATTPPAAARTAFLPGQIGATYRQSR